MNILRSAASRRACVTSVVAVTVVAGLSACSSDSGEVAGAPLPTTTMTSAVPPSTTATTVSKNEASLAASFDKLKVPDSLGVAIAPVGGGDVYVFGDQTDRVAWSTIKVPLAIAAKRKNGNMREIEPAIVDSDNDAALTLRRSLGSPTEGRKLVQKVFRDAGDTTTEVIAIKADDETFGLTVWPIKGAATFTSNLPCIPEAKEIIGFMGKVAGNQQWGVEVMDAPKKTAVKGGWGPGDKGGDEVRQIGIITHRDGRQTAVAISTYTGDPMGTGVADLNKVAAWLDRNLSKLPKGRC